MKIGGAIAAAAMMWFGWLLIRSQADTLSMTTSIGAEDILLHDPVAGAAFTLLKEKFPEDFARIRDAVSGSAGSLDRKAIAQVLQREIAVTLKRNDHFVAQAPHDMLVRFRAVNLAVLERLQGTALPLCAQMASTGNTGDAALSPETSRLGGALLEARLALAAAGRDRPQQRALEITPEDARQAVAAMRAAGASQESIELAVGTRTTAQASQQMQCDAGIDTLRALDAVREDASDRLQIKLVMG